MELLLQRTQRTTFWRSSEYVLHVSLVCSADELWLIDQHRLARNRLYAVPEIETHQDRAQDAFARSDTRSCFRSSGAAKLLGDTVAGAFHAARARLGYVVTIADAIAGTTIACQSLYELLACEEDITAGFDQLDRDVRNALAFSIGREQVLTPDGAEPPAGVAPADWATPPHQWGQR